MQPGKEKLMFGAGLLGIVLTVAGCGGGGSSNKAEPPAEDKPATTSPASLTGTAAVGAAIQTGTVTADCADGSGFTSSVTTASDGSWSGDISSTALPCVLTVTGGTPAVTLRSYASQPGTINITPITDMVLALTTGVADGSWVTNPANWPEATTIASKKTELLTEMGEAGFTLPVGDPFTTPLKIGDAWDQVLDTIQAAIENDPAIADYSALRDLIKDGNLNQFPAAPTGHTNPELPANLNVLTDYAGSYTVIGNATGDPGYCSSCGTANRDHARGTVIISAQGDIDFDNGISFSASDIKEIYDRKTVAADRRIAVNYGASDSDERVRLYLNANLDVMEIIHDDGQGTTTRALIKEETTNPNPVPGGELLGMRNGVAIVANGHTWVVEQPFIETFMATTAKRQIRANNFDSNYNTLDPSLINGEELAWVQVNVAHGSLGTQLCSTGAGASVSMLTVNNTVNPPVQKTWTATACELDVNYHFSNGATEGRIISATLTNDKDAEQMTLSDGQFRIFIHTGIDGEAPALADEILWDLTVDSGTREIRSGHFLGGRPLNDGSHPDHEIDLTVSAGSSNPAVGTYDCGSASVLLKMGWKTTGDPLFKFQSSNGGSCTVTIEQSAGRKFAGNYSATLIGPSSSVFGSGLASGDTELAEAERTLVVHGKFRNFTTQTFRANNADEGALASDAQGITMTIDDGSTHFMAGERFQLTSEPSSNGSNGYFFRIVDSMASPNNQLRMVWSGIPLQVGSHDCNEDVGGLKPAMSLATPANIPYGTSYTQSGTQNLTDGASCTITITSVDGGMVKGSYTGTLVARNIAPVLPDNDASITISGEFRYPYIP